VKKGEERKRGWGAPQLSISLAAALLTASVSVFYSNLRESRATFGDIVSFEDSLLFAVAILIFFFAYAVLYEVLVQMLQGRRYSYLLFFLLVILLASLIARDFRSPEFRASAVVLFFFMFVAHVFLLALGARPVFRPVTIMAVVLLLVMSCATWTYVSGTPIISFPDLVVENPRLEVVQEGGANTYDFFIELRSRRARSRLIRAELVFLDGVKHQDPTAGTRRVQFVEEGTSTTLKWTILIEETPREEFFVWVTSSTVFFGRKVAIYYDTEHESWRCRDSLESVRRLEALIRFLKANAL